MVLVIETRVTRRYRLQLVKIVHDDLRQWKHDLVHDARVVDVRLVFLDSAPLHDEREDLTNVLVRSDDRAQYYGFLVLLDDVRFRNVAWIEDGEGVCAVVLDVLFAEYLY